MAAELEAAVRLHLWSGSKGSRHKYSAVLHSVQNSTLQNNATRSKGDFFPTSVNIIKITLIGMPRGSFTG